MEKTRITQRYFKDVLRSYRLASGLSQEKASELMGISRSYYSLFEIGKRYPTVDMLIHMANVLQVNPGDMLNALIAASKK